MKLNSAYRAALFLCDCSRSVAGKIKFFGVSLGVTFVLFTGIVCGHFGLTGNTQILTFLQDFGLILFVFCIGLQVGPSFSLPLRKEGLL